MPRILSRNSMSSGQLRRHNSNSSSLSVPSIGRLQKNDTRYYSETSLSYAPNREDGIRTPPPSREGSLVSSFASSDSMSRTPFQSSKQLFPEKDTSFSAPSPRDSGSRRSITPTHFVTKPKSRRISESRFLAKLSEQTSDDWGQFIDVAEAEAAIERRSRILSVPTEASRPLHAPVR